MGGGGGVRSRHACLLQVMSGGRTRALQAAGGSTHVGAMRLQQFGWQQLLALVTHHHHTSRGPERSRQDPVVCPVCEKDQRSSQARTETSSDDEAPGQAKVPVHGLQWGGDGGAAQLGRRQ